MGNIYDCFRGGRGRRPCVVPGSIGLSVVWETVSKCLPSPLRSCLSKGGFCKVSYPGELKGCSRHTCNLVAYPLCSHSGILISTAEAELAFMMFY